MLMGRAKANMVFTDPPYGIGYVGGSKKRAEIANDEHRDDFAEFIAKSFEAIPIAPGGPIYVCSPVGKEAGAFFQSWLPDWHYQSCLVWTKNNASFTRFDYHTKHEFIHYGWVAGAAHVWEADRKQDTVWVFDRPGRSELHPTMKPTDLIRYAIGNSSKNGDVVWDSFLGSGSTLIACEQTGRKCYGMELSPAYCDVIIKRWEDFTGQRAVKGEPQEAAA